MVDWIGIVFQTGQEIAAIPWIWKPKPSTCKAAVPTWCNYNVSWKEWNRYGLKSSLSHLIECFY